MKIALALPDPPNFLYDLNPYILGDVDNHTILVDKISDDCDFLIGWSVTQMDKIEKLHKQCPNVPMINYNWDIYKWVWTTPRDGEYDFKRYGELLKKSIEVWCPSESVVKRNKEYFNIKKNHIIKTSAQFFEAKGQVRDRHYALNAMRDMPDKTLHWFKKACEALDIPYQETNKRLSWEAYKEVVQNCSFVVCPMYEASTGGLTLLEAYRLGKPVLMSNSYYQGGQDYFGDKAEYFQYDSYSNFKAKLKDMWENPRKVNIEDAIIFTDQYTPEKMAESVLNRLKELKK
ncbi:MAG TPA: hypothetical protein DEO59_16560 [Balneola sp.]|jgi:hypothetical protein|nr:hypothetical protein [Balneola sp.]|tara:strand:- start:9928 stop:10791 length:864 start_codon:yes stop_codon:yes gene_type:complete